MIPLHLLDEIGVLTEWCAEYHRRTATPSLAGVAPDQPKGSAPSSGRYESLVQLTKGCDRLGLDLVYAKFISWTAHKEVKWGDSETLKIAVAVRIDDGELARLAGLSVSRVRKMQADVYRRVAENLGELKGRGRADMPVITQREMLLRLAREVL